jgi:hypothetical protein
MSRRSMILSAFFFNPQGMRAVLNEADGHPLISWHGAHQQISPVNSPNKEKAL